MMGSLPENGWVGAGYSLQSGLFNEGVSRLRSFSEFYFHVLYVNNKTDLFLTWNTLNTTMWGKMFIFNVDLDKIFFVLKGVTGNVW